MAETQATFKLGIEFATGADRRLSTSTLSARSGIRSAKSTFHHLWRRSLDAGNERPLADYSLAISMALGHRFTRPEADPASILSTFDYAYHFDASLYAALFTAIFGSPRSPPNGG